MNSRTTNRFHKIVIGAVIVMVTSLLTGCGDRTQIEDRDFIMSLCVSYDGNQYKVVFERPDLSSLTGQAVQKKSDLIVSYTGKNFTEIDEKYARSSSKRLDYNHLKAIVIDTPLVTNEKKMKQFLSYVADNYEISRNTLVFYTNDIANTVNSGLGEKLENLYENNPSNMDVAKVTIGDMVNCLYQPDKVLVLPQIIVANKKINLDGGGVFQSGLCVDTVTNVELTGWNLLLGKGTGRYVELNEETNLKMKQVSAKYQYSMSDGIPNVLIYLYGTGEIVQESISTSDVSQVDMGNSVDQILRQKLLNQIEAEHIDILNLYRRMSYRNPLMWKVYQGKQNQFLQEVNIRVQVDMKADSYE